MSWPERYVYVCAIEGVSTLLTNADDIDAVTTAWAGTDWEFLEEPTRGLFVDLDQRQSAHPWEPFQPGGTLRLTIADDAIGRITHRSAGGAETELTESIDQTDTTIKVKDTSAFPEIGIIHIGTEAIIYLSKTSTTFDDCLRGICSPFPNGNIFGDNRYAHNHRVGFVTNAPPLSPAVTQYPRTWIGRWVGLWVHGYKADGTLQTKAEAQLVFAGRLVEVRDDADLISTILVAEHALTDLRKATIGRDFLSGEVADGIYIPASGTGGQTRFSWKDETAGAWREANPLVVVPSGATGTNQMNEGFYTHQELFEKLNTWLAGEYQATRLWGTYTFAIATTQGTPDSLRTKIYWRVAGTANSTVRFRGTFHKTIAIFLGFDGSGTSDSLGTVTIGDSDRANDLHHFYRDHVPLRSWVTTGLSNPFMRVERASGEFQDQRATLPASVNLPANATGEWGLFVFDEQVLVRAKVTDNGDGTLDLQNVHPVLTKQTAPFSEPPLDSYAKRLDDPTPTKIRQVFLFEMTFSLFLNRFVYSGGTNGYNHAGYDVLPYGCGLAWPGGLFSSAWETSVANLPGGDKMIAPFIDRPMKVSQLLGSDMVLRHVFPVWRSQTLRMATWQTPTNSVAVAALTEDNKAEPSGRDVNHRSPTLLSDRWAKNLIKIEYSRPLFGGGDPSIINVEDRTAIDDIGDRGDPFTIEARNTHAQLAQTGAGVQELMDEVFIPVVRLFTRPMRTIRRSVDRTLWDLAPGDVVTVTDDFARDPTTGIRKVANRPALVIGSHYNPGGWRPVANGKPSTGPVTSEVDLMFVETNRIYAYAPSALIDSTANDDGFSGGYNSSTNTIRLAEHAYSEASEDADAAHFPVSSAVIVHEVDPDDPSSAQSWTAVVEGVNGNDLTLDTALTSFDSGKIYRVTFDSYSNATSEQRGKAFQADDADGLVEDAAQAYQFGLVTSPILATVSEHTDLPERHAELTYGDGVAYDVGSLVGAARLVENLIDHKTAFRSPFLSNVVMTNTTYSSGSGFKIVAIAPLFLSEALLSNNVVRYLKVAPWLRLADGVGPGPVSVRVSLCRTRPNGNTLDDGYRGEVFSDATFSSSSTTWTKADPALLTINIKNVSDGIAWLVIECGFNAETRGLAECTEQERMEF